MNEKLFFVIWLLYFSCTRINRGINKILIKTCLKKNIFPTAEVYNLDGITI